MAEVWRDELIIAMGLGDMSMADRLEYFQKKGLTGIPASELLDYMEAVVRGIDFLNSPVHDLGDGPHSAIRHCDIKPQNMMIVGGSVQICDFGLARAESDVRLTSAAVSPAYGVPECIDGNLPTPTTDQYSLAVSYVEIRTGSLPFSDPGSYMGVVKGGLTGNLDLDRLPPDEREVIRKATSRDPAERYANCQKMVKGAATGMSGRRLRIAATTGDTKRLVAVSGHDARRQPCRRQSCRRQWNYV